MASRFDDGFKGVDDHGVSGAACLCGDAAIISDEGSLSFICVSHASRNCYGAFYAV